MANQRRQGQVAVVTSSAQGIVLAIATRLHADGTHVERAKNQDWPARATPGIPVLRAADIAEGVAFLASPADRLTTGETIIAGDGTEMV